MTPRLRFAPSPNGALHLGHAYSALLNERVAGRLGGTWLLRMEDIDRVRATPERVAAVETDLAWLGLAWPRPVRHQSRHMADYAAAADGLRARGLAYPCFCSRRDVASAVSGASAWPCDPDGTPVYPGTCRQRDPDDAARRIRSGMPHGWRLDVTAALAKAGLVTWRRFEPVDGAEASVAADPARWGDVILVRRDVPTSYHLSVVCDDAAQDITHVVRGRDLEAATDVHALLARLLDLPSPRYHHHALLPGPDGRKLAKSRGSESLDALRGRGETPADIRRRLGFD